VLRIIFACVLASTITGETKAAPKDVGGLNEAEAINQVFSSHQRSLLTNYYRNERGLARRNLQPPPAAGKHLRRNRTLPSGLETRLVPFPARIELLLPPCPPDVRRGFIGAVAVMYSPESGLILDAFSAASR
jgi:hypothetical protein